MQGVQIAVDGDEKHNEKVIKVCGTQLGQCQQPITSNDQIEMRLCCLDCNFSHSDIDDGSAFQKPRNADADRKNLHVKVIVALIVISLLIGTTVFLAWKKYFIKPARRMENPEMAYFKNAEY